MAAIAQRFPLQVVDLAARWYVFIFLNIYGIGKMIGGQFYRRDHLPPDVAKTLLGEAGPFELAWTFMGYSFAYMTIRGTRPALVASRWPRMNPSTPDL